MKSQNNFILTSFLISLFLSFFPAINFAEPVPAIPLQKTTSLFEGSILFSEQGLYIQQLESTVPLKLLFQDPNTELLLHGLAQGDFLSVQAQKNNTNELTVSGINYVGLVSLLGTWLGDDNVCYYFKSFTTFYIFNSDAQGACNLPKNSSGVKNYRKMSYFITPDDMGWFLLISDKSTQYAAELMIKNSKTIQINLFDEQTGDILSKVILRR